MLKWLICLFRGHHWELISDLREANSFRRMVGLPPIGFYRCDFCERKEKRENA